MGDDADRIFCSVMPPQHGGNMKVNVDNIGGDIVKDNETYPLKDNKLLKSVLSIQISKIKYEH